MFKNNVIENKKKKDFLKKQRLNVINLRNKFLAEWASSILELNDKEKLIYIKNITLFKYPSSLDYDFLERFPSVFP